jgi:hypothetical protein
LEFDVLERLKKRVLDSVGKILVDDDGKKLLLLGELDSVWKTEFAELRRVSQLRIRRERAHESVMSDVRGKLRKVVESTDSALTAAALQTFNQFYGDSHQFTSTFSDTVTISSVKLVTSSTSLALSSEFGDPVYEKGGSYSSAYSAVPGGMEGYEIATGDSLFDDDVPVLDRSLSTYSTWSIEEPSSVRTKRHSLQTMLSSKSMLSRLDEVNEFMREMNTIREEVDPVDDEEPLCTGDDVDDGGKGTDDFDIGTKTERRLTATEKAKSALKDKRLPKPLVKIPSALLRQLKRFGDWDFDPFSLNTFKEEKGSYLCFAVLSAMESFGLCDSSSASSALFPTPLMANYLKAVEANYGDEALVPYHNVYHALDVTSTMVYLLRTRFMRAHLSKLDVLSAIIAACVHDLSHDGTNNEYHCATRSELAITYNDASVLENMHVAAAFRLLREDENNWFATMEYNAQRYVRRMVIAMVLGTDMAKHGRSRTALREFYEAIKEEKRERGSKVSVTDYCAEHTALRRNGAISVVEKGIAAVEWRHVSLASPLPSAMLPMRVDDCDDERALFMDLALHLCDISNPAKPLSVYKQFAERVMNEFWSLGDVERDAGVAVSWDRDKNTLEAAQIGFITFVVKDYFSEMSVVFDELREPMQIIKENLDYWKSI